MNFRKLVQRHRGLIPFMTLIILVLLVGINAPVFLTVGSILTTMTDTATLFIMAAGITFVIMLGGIDLSGQSTVALASIVCSMSVVHWGYAAIPLAILTGMVVGLISGLVHVHFKLPSFIATLAVGSVAASAALLLSGERSVPISAENRDTYFFWIVGETLGIPNQIIVGFVVLLVSLCIERFTKFGYWSRAVGSGEPAALAIGVPITQVKVTALVLSGAFAGFAGLVLGARLGSGSPTIANETLLPAIAAIVVGGTAITGGTGSVIYTLIGALMISVVRIGMTFIGVDIFAQQIVFGVLIVIAAAATIDRSKLSIVK
jgi:ribose transport system permease protein